MDWCRRFPAFVVSVAAAMLVTRSASKTNLGEELLGQLTSQPVALILTAGFLLVLAVTPLPKPPIVLLAGSAVGMSYLLNRRQQVVLAQASAAKAKPPVERVEKHLAPGPHGTQRRVRSGSAGRSQAGRRSPRPHHQPPQAGSAGDRHHRSADPHPRRRAVAAQRLLRQLKGLQIGKGEVLPGHLLAIDTGSVAERVGGVETKEPAFGLPAVWVDESARHLAEQRNYTVVDCSTVVSTYLTELVRRHAEELLTRQEFNRLIDNLKERAPKLVEEIVPNVLKPGEIQRVLQGAVRERVPIRDLS